MRSPGSKNGKMQHLRTRHCGGSGGSWRENKTWVLSMGLVSLARCNGGKGFRWSGRPERNAISALRLLGLKLDYLRR